MVPNDSSASWWRLTRHFQVVACYDVGSDVLESMRFGRWMPYRSRREALILSFPRAAGGLARPVWAGLDVEYTLPNHVINVEGTARGLPMPQGSFVYQIPWGAGQHGVLYEVWRSFDPAVEGSIYDATDSDVRSLEIAQLTRSFTYSGKPRVQVWSKVGGKFVYQLDLSRQGESFAPGRGHTPWLVRADLLWAVDHLFTELPSTGEVFRSPRGGGLLAKSEAKRRFTFDYLAAERDIALGLGMRERPPPLAAPETPTALAAGQTRLVRPLHEQMMPESRAAR